MKYVIYMKSFIAQKNHINFVDNVTLNIKSVTINRPQYINKPVAKNITAQS